MTSESEGDAPEEAFRLSPGVADTEWRDNERRLQREMEQNFSLSHFWGSVSSQNLRRLQRSLGASHPQLPIVFFRPETSKQNVSASDFWTDILGLVAEPQSAEEQKEEEEGRICPCFGNHPSCQGGMQGVQGSSCPYAELRVSICEYCRLRVLSGNLAEHEALCSQHCAVYAAEAERIREEELREQRLFLEEQLDLAGGGGGTLLGESPFGTDDEASQFSQEPLDSVEGVFCPICNFDMSGMNVVARTEHVNLCCMTYG